MLPQILIAGGNVVTAGGTTQAVSTSYLLDFTQPTLYWQQEAQGTPRVVHPACCA